MAGRCGTPLCTGDHSPVADDAQPRRRYLNKVLREDMDNYRIYIFRKAKPAAEPKEELLEAEYHVMDEPVQQTMPEPEPPKVELIPETIVKLAGYAKRVCKVCR